jgi:hypothetical protein
MVSDRLLVFRLNTCTSPLKKTFDIWRDVVGELGEEMTEILLNIESLELSAHQFFNS